MMVAATMTEPIERSAAVSLRMRPPVPVVGRVLGASGRGVMGMRSAVAVTPAGSVEALQVAQF